MNDDRVGPFIAAFLLSLPVIAFFGCEILMVSREHGPASMSPEVARIAAAFESGDIAAVASGRAVVLEHHVRAKLGTGMWLVVERTLDLKLPEGYSLQAKTRAWLDGEELKSAGERRHACPGSGPGSIVPSFQPAVVLNRAHTLLPDTEHLVRVSSELSLTNPAGAEVWSTTHSTEHPVSVVLGLPFEQIRLVGRGDLGSKLDVRALPPAVRVGKRQRVFPAIAFSCNPLPLTVSSTVEVLNDAGEVIKRTDLLIPSGSPGGTILPLVVQSLTPGQHRLTVRLTPQPRIALRRTARVMEIYGEPYECQLTVEAR